MADKKKNVDQERWDALGAYYTNNQVPGGYVWMDGNTSLTLRQAESNIQYMFVNDPKQFKYFSSILKNKGYTGSINEVVGYAMQALPYVSSYQQYQNKFSIEDFFLALPSQDDGSGAGGGPTRVKYRTEVASLSNRGDAEVVLNNAYEQFLGRRATSKEVKAFYKALNELEKKNPSISEGVSVGNAGSSQQTGTSRGGFNAQEFAQDWAMSNPQYAETFAATTFMNVIESMINRGPSLGGNA